MHGVCAYDIRLFVDTELTAAISILDPSRLGASVRSPSYLHTIAG
jgi:hypothetical protein